MASKDNTPLPEDFCREKLEEFNRQRKIVRKSTCRSSFDLMTGSEKAKTRAAWKVVMSDALIYELNKEKEA